MIPHILGHFLKDTGRKTALPGPTMVVVGPNVIGGLVPIALMSYLLKNFKDRF
jgi:hypothetical protein